MNEDVPTTTVPKIVKLGDFLLSFWRYFFPRFFGGIDFHKKPRRPRPRWSRQGNDRIAPRRDLKTGPSSMCLCLLCLLARCGSNGLVFSFFQQNCQIFRWRHCNSGMLFSMALFCVFLGLWRPSYRIFIFIEAICTTNKPTNQPPHCGSCNFFRVPHHQHGSHCTKPSSQNRVTAMITCPPWGS